MGVLQNAVKNHRQEVCSRQRFNLALQEQFSHRMFPQRGTLSHPKAAWACMVKNIKAADGVNMPFCLLLMSDGL